MKNRLSDTPGARTSPSPLLPNSQVAIQIAHVTKRFSGVQVLNDISFSLTKSELLGVIGPNGAGKSTLINVLSGAVRADEGKYFLNDESVQSAGASRLAHRGVARTFQTPRGLRNGTVAENIGASLSWAYQDILGSVWSGKRRWGKAMEAIRSAACICGVERLLHKTYGEISGGEARMVDLARAIVANPRFLLLDEPTAGLDTAKQNTLRKVIENLQQRAVSILIVEHNLPFLLDVVPKVLVMAEGRVVTIVDASLVQSDDLIRKIYFGKRSGERVGKYNAKSVCESDNAGSGHGQGTKWNAVARWSENLSRLDVVDSNGIAVKLGGVHGGYGRIAVVHDVSLSVRRGTGVAIAGPNGAGKSTLLKIISGVIRPMQGMVCVSSDLFYVPQETVAFPTLTVEENLQIVLAAKKRLSRGLRADLGDALDVFHELKAFLRRPVGHLSGGQRQMLGLACAWLSAESIVLLDEPTSGLAPSVVDRLNGIIVRFLDEGRTLLWVVEQSPQDALEIVDEVCVLSAGKVIFSGTPNELGGVRGLSSLVLGATG